MNIVESSSLIDCRAASAPASPVCGPTGPLLDASVTVALASSRCFILLGLGFLAGSPRSRRFCFLRELCNLLRIDFSKRISFARLPETGRNKEERTSAPRSSSVSNVVHVEHQQEELSPVSRGRKGRIYVFTVKSVPCAISVIARNTTAEPSLKTNIYEPDNQFNPLQLHQGHRTHFCVGITVVSD